MTHPVPSHEGQMPVHVRLPLAAAVAQQPDPLTQPAWPLIALTRGRSTIPAFGLAGVARVVALAFFGGNIAPTRCPNASSHPCNERPDFVPI